MVRDGVVRFIRISLLIFLMQYSCGGGNLPAAERTDYAGFTLSPVLRINPEEGTLREPSYLRTPAIHRDRTGTVRVAWTRSADTKLILQSLTQEQKNFSDPSPVYSDEASTWDDFPTILQDPQKDKLYLSAWRKSVISTSKSAVRRTVGIGGKFNSFSVSDDNGKTWGKGRPVSSGNGAFNPAMVCDEEGRIYIAWRDERDSNADLYINRSLDSGETWLDKEVRISPGGAGKGIANFATILPHKDGHVTVVFSYAEMDKNCAIYSVSSKDYGATWDEPVRINDNPEIHMDLPQAVRRGQEITVTWHYVSDKVNSIYLDQSQDGGKTWTDDRIIYSNPAGLSLISLKKGGQDTLHLFWQNYSQEGTSIMYMHSGDFGKTWVTEEKSKGRITQGQKQMMDVLRVGANGDDLAAIWRQKDPTNGDRLMINLSRDNGKTWLSETVPIATAVLDKNQCGVPLIWMEKDSIHFLWSMTGKGNKFDLYYRSLLFKK